jgi:hypothetical protein
VTRRRANRGTVYRCLAVLDWEADELSCAEALCKLRLYAAELSHARSAEGLDSGRAP